MRARYKEQANRSGKTERYKAPGSMTSRRNSPSNVPRGEGCCSRRIRLVASATPRTTESRRGRTGTCMPSRISSAFSHAVSVRPDAVSTTRPVPPIWLSLPSTDWKSRRALRPRGPLHPCLRRSNSLEREARPGVERLRVAPGATQPAHARRRASDQFSQLTEEHSQGCHGIVAVNRIKRAKVSQIHKTEIHYI